MNLLRFKRLVKYVLRNKLNVVDDLLLSQMLLDRLLSLPKDRWPYYYRSFNHWEFPEAFYDLIPGWYNPQKNYHDRLMVITRKVFNAISTEFSREQLLRVHNVEYGNMTDDEFNYWNGLKWEDGGFNKYYHRQIRFKKLKFWEDEIWERLKAVGLVDTPENIKDN